MKNFREIEQLSAYLDGHLSEAERARVESRLNSDPELASVLSDLRAARGILRKLPARKAPRNFTLTRKMVGLKPPLPRSYPIFRFASVFASLMLMLSFTMNALSPYVSFRMSNNMVMGGFGSGGGGDETELAVGGGCEGPCGEEPAAAAPMMEMEPMPAEGERISSAPAEESQTDTQQATKEAEVEEPLAPENEAESPSAVAAPISFPWLVIWFVIGGISSGVMWFMHRAAVKKWQ